MFHCHCLPIGIPRRRLEVEARIRSVSCSGPWFKNNPKNSLTPWGGGDFISFRIKQHERLPKEQFEEVLNPNQKVLMKTTGRWVLVAGLLFAFAFPPPAISQVATRAPDKSTTTNALDQAAARAAAPQWQSRNRSAHQTEWFSVRYQTNAGTGKVRAMTNSYVEIATGLNFIDPATGKWTESKEEIELIDGGAMARQGQHRVVFAANINTAGAIQTTASDGKTLRSHVLGLAYTDASTGESVLIAGVRDTIGEVARNQVIYRDAFDGPFKADLRYTYTKAGFEQDVIFREAPPSPEKFGMDPQVTRLEVWTELLSPPEPVKTDSVLKVEGNALVRSAMVDPDLTDETLDFGAMRIASGTAFSIDEGADAVDKQEIPVGKNWLRLEGRNFLIEKVDFEDALPSLEKLPAAPGLQPGDSRKQAALPAKPKQQLLAALKAPVREKDRAQGNSKPMRMAAAFPIERGFVLDYTQVNSQSGMVFEGHETYYVSSTVNLTGTTVIEGGTVVKYAPGASTARLSIAGPIDCRTESYRPAYFTARDDNSVGAIISGSTGTPTGYYASHIFWITDSTSIYDFHDLRLRYGNQAILRTLAGSTAPMTFRHSQVQDCNRAFGNYASPLTLRNVLVYRTRIGFYSSAVNIGENVTFHRIHQLVTGSMPPLQLKNTLLISCTNNVSYVADPTVFKPTTVADAGIFQTVGLASHYLAAGSPHREQGTPNINAALLNELKHTTTWPPVVLSGTLAEDKILGPDVQRNSTTAPDRGYAYNVMDYVLQSYVVQGTAQSPVTLLVTNGAVVGTDPAAGGYGIHFGGYSELVSVGAPGKLNRFANIRAVQETEVPAASSGSSSTFSSSSSMDTPNAILRFTELLMYSGWQTHFSGDGFRNICIHDCQMKGGYWDLGYFDDTQKLGFTNSFIRDVVFTLYADVEAHFRNNLFKDGYISIDVSGPLTRSRTMFDNLFDGMLIEQFETASIVHDYNAYILPASGLPLLDAGAHDQTLTASPVYESGPFGDFYLPSTATQLIDQGSRTAAQAGLYHYTSSNVAESKEAVSQVDIGLHYVGAASGNEPVDTDEDGFADYHEDRSGNGRHEMSMGERRWQGLPPEPIVKFSPEPLEYYPNAGLLPLDLGATVIDNDDQDENFLILTNMTVETAAGDLVRLVPVPNVLNPTWRIRVGVRGICWGFGVRRPRSLHYKHATAAAARR